MNRAYQIPILYEKTKVQTHLKQYNLALQTLETANDIDTENILNKKQYNKLRLDIAKLTKEAYFTTLKHQKRTDTQQYVENLVVFPSINVVLHKSIFQSLLL